MNRSRTIIFGLVFLCMSASLFSIEIKVGTTAPAGSPWEFALKELASRWETESRGKVKLKIYMGGVAGSEEDMMRKIRIGQLQGVVVTGNGLSTISSEFLSLILPMFIRSDAEIDYLFSRMGKRFESIVREKGFAVVAWQQIGWVYVFSRRPAPDPASLMEMRLALPISDSSFQQIWKSMGFRVVPILTTDFMTSLQTGMVEAIINSPMVTAAYQWFPLAPYMNGIGFAPLMGALVLDKRTWERIPEDLRPRLQEIAREVIEPLSGDTRKLEMKAVEFMRGMGLSVVQPDDRVIEEWRTLCESGYDNVIGKEISRDLFEEMKAILDEFRTLNSTD